MTTTHTNFLGIPVEGDITKTEVRPAQRPLPEFEPLVRALLDDPTIVEFGWSQYTPYFNDGDPCVFSANGLWVRTVADGAPKTHDDDEDEDSYDDEEPDEDKLSVVYGHPTLGKTEWRWLHIDGRTIRQFHSYIGPDQARMERCVELDQAIQGGAFDDVLIGSFGDHAKILVKKTNIIVEFYDHD